MNAVSSCTARYRRANSLSDSYIILPTLRNKRLAGTDEHRGEENESSAEARHRAVAQTTMKRLSKLPLFYTQPAHSGPIYTI